MTGWSASLQETANGWDFDSKKRFFRRLRTIHVFRKKQVIITNVFMQYILQNTFCCSHLGIDSKLESFLWKRYPFVLKKDKNGENLKKVHWVYKLKSKSVRKIRNGDYIRLQS